MQHVPWLFVNKVDDLLQSLIIVGTINDTLPCPEQNESSCLDSHITDVGDSNFWSVLGWTVILVSQNHQHDVLQVGCVTVTVRCENWVGGETYLEPWPVPACSPRSVWSCWRRSPEPGLRRTRTAASCLSSVSPSNLRSKIYHHLSSISFVDGGLENSCTLYYLSMLFCHLSGRCHNIHQKILPITFNLVLHFGFFLFFLGSLNRLRFIFFHPVSQILCLNFKILNQSLQLRNFFTFFPNIFFSL